MNTPAHALGHGFEISDMGMGLGMGTTPGDVRMTEGHLSEFAVPVGNVRQLRGQG